MSAIAARYKTVRDALPWQAWAVIGLGVAIAYPYIIFAALGDVSGGTLMENSITTLAYVIMALGLNIVVGFAGLLDLGYVAFFAIGAFVMGWLASASTPKFYSASFHFLVNNQILVNSTIPDAHGHMVLHGIHINFIFVVVIAAFFTMMWGAVLGYPTLRLRGDYLAIVTLAFGEIVPRVFENNPSLSTGRRGISPIDHISFPGVPLSVFNYPIELHAVYFVALAMVLIVLYWNVSLRDSRLGRAWIAIREDEVAAAAMGINLVRSKLWAYGFGAAFGGFAGAFLATFNNTVNVSNFDFGVSVFILAMVILGGMGNVAGVILGAVILSMFNLYGLDKLDSLSNSLNLGFDFSGVKFGVFGFFMLVVMIIRPAGLIPSRRRRMELEHGELIHDAALYEVRQ